MTEPAANARPSFDLVVIGGGIAGQVAALESAKLGLRVALLAPAEELGGSLRTLQLGELLLDAGAEQFVEGDAFAALCAELELPVETLADRHTLLSTPTALAEIPADSLAGIPGNPLGSALKPFVSRGRWRAYADRVIPFLKIGEARNLGALVQQRLGRRVLVGFTEPHSQAVYGCAAEHLDIARVIPELNRTITSLGSLSGAALALASAPRPSAQRPLGGMRALLAALTRRLQDYLVEQIDARVNLLDATDDGWLIADTELRVVHARAVIAAVDPAELGRERPAAERPLLQSRQLVLIELEGVTSVVSATGVLYADTAGALRGASRVSARSAELAAALPPGHELLRLTLDGSAEPDALPELIDRALSDLGLSGARPVQHAQVDWQLLRPWVCLGDPVPGEPAGADDGSMEFAGQWVSGPGLGRVTANAIEVAHRVRRVAMRRRLEAGT